jgi:hypothetical protein
MSDARNTTDRTEAAMKTYQISSKAGQVMGYFNADSAAEALAELHNEAGYPCYVMAGEDKITFRGDCNLNATGEDFCGQTEDWHVIEMSAAQARWEQEQAE